MELLKKLYTTHSPSRKEKAMSELVQAELKAMGASFSTDIYHQIYSIRIGKPLVCAHLDQVQKIACKEVVYHKGNVYGLNNHRQCGLGADDKNGIWILLNLIKKYKGEISFIFSAQEESGGKIATLLPRLILNDTPYCLVFDRKGKKDIIGTSNFYCNEDLEEALEELLAKDGFSATMGVYSDCDAINNYVPCVNISCGYYCAHTTYEYTDLKALVGTLAAAEKIIEELERKQYDMPEIKCFSRGGYLFNPNGKNGNYGLTIYDDFEIWDHVHEDEDDIEVEESMFMDEDEENLDETTEHVIITEHGIFFVDEVGDPLHLCDFWPQDTNGSMFSIEEGYVKLGWGCTTKKAILLVGKVVYLLDIEDQRTFANTL